MKEVTFRVEDPAYEPFMAFANLCKQVSVVKETELKARVVKKRGRPRTAGMPAMRSFDYTARDKNMRLLMLCDALKALGWIEKHTDMQAFVNLFSGGEVRERVTWTGDVNTLSELFRRLVNERKLVSLPVKHTIWRMVAGHFWYQKRRQEFDADRLRRTHAPQKHGQAIDYLVKILDPAYGRDDIRKLLERMR